MSEESGQYQAEIHSRFTKLEPMIWHQMLATDDADAYAQAWLALACNFIGDITCGVVVIGEADTGPYAPVSYWPDQASFDPELSHVAEKAMQERKGIAVPHSSGKGNGIAYPLFIDQQLLGVVAVLSTSVNQPAQRVIRQLQWGSAWMESFLRRQQVNDFSVEHERTSTAFDILASVLEFPEFKDSANAVVTELALRLDCDPVSIGFVRKNTVTVESISHAAQFGKNMNLLRAIARAMEEAVDQQAVILYPPQAQWDYRVSSAHEELCKLHNVASVLTLPLQSNGTIIGALTFERDEDNPFTDSTVEICDAVATIIGPILEEKRQNDRNVFLKIGSAISLQLNRLFGENYFGRKLATATFLLLVILFSVIEGDYRVASPATLEGEVQRSIVSPFDGYLASQHARPGEIVKQGDILAVLDDRDLKLEKLRWTTNQRQRATEFDRAMAERERAQANIAQAQMDQAEAQVELIDEQLARTRIKAPFDAVIVSGDLSQQVGGVLQRGAELFKIAPLNAYRVILEVDEGDIADLKVGQTGHLRLASVPEENFTYSVERITPIASQKEGRNFFNVEASLESVSMRLRPGMAGVGKTYVDDRLLIKIWTRRLMNWIRLKLWEWMP